MNKTILLLKTLLLSSSQRNIYKHTTDKKTRQKITGSFIGSLVLYVMLMAYSILMCVGYGTFGMISDAPVMLALIISVLAFVFTIFKTNGYLFNFKEYDMLMSLPFETKTVAACKFLYMYIQSLPWYLSISLAMMIGYGYFARPSFVIYPIWILLSFILPVIPTLIASFLGFLIAKLSAGLPRSNVLQTVLTFLLVIPLFFLRFFIEDIFRNDKVAVTLEKTSEVTGGAAGVYLPAKWFADAVTKTDLPGILLLVGVSGLLFAAVFRIVGSSYRNINSALKSHAAAKNYRMTAQKQRSVLNAIAFKEYRRMIGSTTYMVNVGMGEILAALIGIFTLIIGAEKLVAMITHNAPFDPAILQPAIPFIVYFFIGMAASTACSPSLEGKNYWILQSLPIEKKTVYQGKMLFNMYLTVPFMVFSILCLCISAKVPVVNTLLYLILGLALCAFSTAWGCVCGVKHMRLDWDNEVEVIKQGAAVGLYMLPNMIVVMLLVVGVVFIGMHMDHRLLTLIFILIASALAALCYMRVMALSKKA